MKFLALPDCPAGANIAERVPSERRIDYPSGRPWLLGDWPGDEVAVIDAGKRRMVVFGFYERSTLPSASTLANMSSLRDVDATAFRLPGLFHLAVTFDGDSRLQGSVSGVRQVFMATVDGATVAASEVDLLLRLTDDDLDEAALAARLLAPGGAPWPISQQPVRRNVQPLRTGHWLWMRGRAHARQIRWWSLPDATLPLAHGAGAVRSALVEALETRVAPGGRISADLSGGLDSTSLCFAADAAGADLITYHVAPLDEANEDRFWAHKAAEHLPNATHHTLSAHRAENLFDVGYTQERAGSAPEGPATWAAGLAHIHQLARQAAGEGATVHLAGFGGDELFGRIPTCAWSLVRARPFYGVRLVNRYRLANRWPWRATAQGLLDRSSFADNLRSLSTRLAAPLPPVNNPDFTWLSELRMPGWATPDAVALVRDLLRTTANETPEPLDPDRARHQALASIAFEGATIRQINTALDGAGIQWDAPFLDDRVLGAAFSTRIDHRLAAGRFKPLLASAASGMVPSEILHRRDKGEFSVETFRGLEQNRDRLLALADESELAARGLIDPDGFRDAVLNPGPMSHHPQPIETTVACESWIRAHTPRESGVHV